MDNYDLYLEIADFSKEEGYIKYPCYSSHFYKNYNDEIIPFSTYYLSSLQLLTFDSSREENQLDLYMENLEKVWMIANSNNHSLINQIVKSSSDNIRKIVRNSTKYSKGIHMRFSDFRENTFNDMFSDFNEQYELWKKNNLVFVNDFENKDKGCVAIAMPIDPYVMDDSNCYLSISGASKDYSGPSMTQSISSDVHIAYNAINDLLESVFGYRFIECHLTDDTRRYTRYSRKKKFTRGDSDGRPIQKPVKYIVDYNNHSDKKIVYAHYSCCERKILSQMNFVNLGYNDLILGKKVVNLLTSYEFRIKKEPCRMCRPALIGCYNIGFAHYDMHYYFFGPYCTKEIVLDNTDKKEPLCVIGKKRRGNNV